MRYANLETTGGGSSSGVLNDNGEVVAVHTHSGGTSSGGAIHGVFIDQIAQASNLLSAGYTYTKVDMLVWRLSNGRWYVRLSGGNWNTTLSRQWGTSGDIPIAGTDLDGN